MKELNFDHETDFDKWLMSDEGDPYGAVNNKFDGMQIRDGEHLDDMPEDDAAYDAFLDSVLDEDEE